MLTGDHRKDWAMPDTDCWVADENGNWLKGKVMSFAPGGYLVMLMGEHSSVRKVREYEIRPRDMYSYGKDKPSTGPLEKRK